MIGVYEGKGVLILLSLRQLQTKLIDRIDDAPHKQWSEQVQSAIVLLWGLLIYPQLDHELGRKLKTVGVISIPTFQTNVAAYTDEWSSDELLELFVQHDYIRLTDDQKHMYAGTKLFSAVHAHRLYRFFRSSVIASQLFQEMKKTSTLT
jgi:hypothetical protein